MKAINFGSSQPLAKHTISNRKQKYTTPAPGHYATEGKAGHRFKNPQTSRFGGTMCQVDRAATGLAAEGMRKKDEPGPAHYSATSGLQALNVKESSPKTKFGSSTRDHSKGIYVHRLDTSGSGDPNHGSAGRGVPGPGHYGVGSMPHKPKSPQYSFGGRHATLDKPNPLGPGNYDHTSTMGKQASSTAPSSPIFGFGSGSREKANRVNSPGFAPTPAIVTPAPGAYKTGSGVGRQAQSNYATANTWSFGSDQRLKESKAVTTVPGPGRYATSSTLGIQNNSRQQTSASFKFGTSERAGLSEGLVG